MSELEKLRLKLAELEEAIALARGESCRANFKLLYLTDQRSDCLKQVAQLTLATNFQLALGVLPHQHSPDTAQRH